MPNTYTPRSISTSIITNLILSSNTTHRNARIGCYINLKSFIPTDTATFHICTASVNFSSKQLGRSAVIHGTYLITPPRSTPYLSVELSNIRWHTYLPTLVSQLALCQRYLGCLSYLLLIVNMPRPKTTWSLADTYSSIPRLLYLFSLLIFFVSDFIATFVVRSDAQNLPTYLPILRRLSPSKPLTRQTRFHRYSRHPDGPLSSLQNVSQKRYFHNYFVTNLPSSSLHPDSRSSTGPHHKLPRAASTPHNSASGPSPAAAPPMIGMSRELTVVRIPLQSAKHHFGVSVSRGQRPYNEDTYQAGTLEIPAFAKRGPISLTRSSTLR